MSSRRTVENRGAFIARVGQILFPYRGLVWGFLGILAFLLARPRMGFFALGLCLLGLGEVLRIWAVGYIQNYRGAMEKDVAELTTSGPYAYTRNPLYLANGIIGTGVVFLSGVWWMMILFWTVFVVLYGSIARAEESFLENKFGDTYRKYRSAVPSFWFRTVPYPGEKKPFSWKTVFQKEITTLVTLGLTVLLFYLRGLFF